MRECEVLVIGGGIAGASLLYHLTRLGHRDAVLVEKDELTSGSTWHAAGLCTQFNSSAACMRLLRNSIDLYASLEAETGQAVDLHRCGSVRLACTAERLDEYHHRQGLAQNLQIPFEMISAERVGELFPLLDLSGVLGAAYLPSDGYVDPTSVTHALAKGAAAHGAQILRRTRVRGIERSGHAWVVDTNAGPIRAHTVVNAAGQWASEIGRMVGVELPIVPLEHHYLITEPLSEVRALSRELPVLRDVDASFYVREEGGGLLVGPFERHTKTWGEDGIPDDFHSRLLPPDLERLETVLAGAARRIPVFGSAGIRTVLNGPDGYTPDGRCLMGPVPGCPNFHVLAGFSIFGIVFSGGAGCYAAEWISRGEPSVDLWELDLRRFPVVQAEAGALASRACDVYGHEYAIHYPEEESAAGRPLRTSPVYELLRDRGAVFGTALGWERPLWYDAPGATPTPSFRRGPEHPLVAGECRALATHAGLLDDTALAKFELSGPGAASLLERLCTTALPDTETQLISTLLCNRRGGIECALRVLRTGEDHYLLLGAAEMERRYEAWIREQVGAGPGVSLGVVSERVGVFRIAGPRASQVVGGLAESAERLAVSSWCGASFQGALLRILRVDEIANGEYEVHHPIEIQEHLYRHFVEIGQPWGLSHVGSRAYDAFRLETGAHEGRELSTHRTPFEVGWSARVDFEKGDFVGRAALLEARAKGGEERLVAMVIETDGADPVGGEPVYAGAEIVASVHRGGYGYRTQASIAWAYLAASSAEVGIELEVRILGVMRRARVVGTPLPINE